MQWFCWNDCNKECSSKSLYRDLDEHTYPIINVNGVEYMNIIRSWQALCMTIFATIYQEITSSASNKYWKVFVSVDSLQRGDFIVAHYDDEWRIKEDKTTGHIMIAWEIKKTGKSDEVAIQVMDATSSAYTATADTRTMNSKPIAKLLNGKKSGIGFGDMLYKISENGRRKPYGYKWSLNSSKWYNLLNGDQIHEKPSSNGTDYNRLKGIVFVRAL